MNRKQEKELERLNDQRTLLALEFGYKACENGRSLTWAKSELREVLKSKPKGIKKVKTSKELGLSLVRNVVVLVAVLFSILPSNARAQSVNSAPSVYDSTRGITNVSSHQSINSDQGGSSGGSLGLNPLLQPARHAVETGSKNDSNWTGPNFFVTLDEAKQLAEQQRLATANNNLSIAEAAKKAKEEADKAKAASAAKTVTVVVQDADGNMVYVKKARKP